MNLRVAQLLLVGWICWILWKSELWSNEPWFLFPCLLVAGLACWPAMRWIGRGAASVPLGEAYCLLHIVYYVVPLLDEREAVLVYSAEVRWKALLAVSLFLGCMQGTYLWMMRPPSSPQKPAWERRVPDQTESALAWTLFYLWILFQVFLTLGLLPNVGKELNVVRTVFMAGGMFAVFCFSYRLGKETLAGGERFFFLVGLACYLFLEFTSGFLVSGGTVLLSAMLAYTMARKRAPIIVGLCCFLGLSFLHAGKADYRAEFWDEATTEANEAARNPIKAYSHWFAASWDAWFSAKTEEKPDQGLIERGSLLQMISLVVQETPANLPYLDGLTYKQLGILLTPRAFTATKARGTLPSETLAIYYGLQTEQDVEKTSVGLGPIAEAWSNFGWLGVMAAGAVIGLILGKGANFSLNATPSQPGFMIAALMVPASLDMEHCLAQTITMLVHTLAMGWILTFLLSSVVQGRAAAEASIEVPPTTPAGEVPPSSP